MGLLLCCAVLQVVLELAASKASLDFHSPVVEAAFGSFHCSCLRGWGAVGGACLGWGRGWGGGWREEVLVRLAGMVKAAWLGAGQGKGRRWGCA